MESIRPKLELDPSLYSVDGEELAFLQKLTGISDEVELKEHIIKVQQKAYEVYGYPCIRGFRFLKLRISRNPGYKIAFDLLKVRQSPILLDIGCCFGNDLRKAVEDGWPVQDTVASDLRKEFWDAGHELFRSTPKSFPAAFVQGDVFDASFLRPSSAEDLKAQTLLLKEIAYQADRPDLKEIKSFNPLRGQISAIHASSFFHLFDENGQLDLARRLASLLVPKPGSIIFGQHIALPERGVKTTLPREGRTREMFCHSASSWEKLWVDEVFGAAGLKAVVTANLIDITALRADLKLGFNEGQVWMLSWSVVIA